MIKFIPRSHRPIFFSGNSLDSIQKIAEDLARIHGFCDVLINDFYYSTCYFQNNKPVYNYHVE